MKDYKVISCGVAGDNRPNVVLEDVDGNKIPKWYHSTFYRVDDALDFLKDLYRDGISKNDIDDGLWLSIQQLQEQ